MHSLRQLYLRELSRLDKNHAGDQNQLNIIAHLQKFSDNLRLNHSDDRHSDSWFPRWFAKWFESGGRAEASRQKHNLECGIYLWGDVGVGKTFLLNLLFQYVPTAKKKRMHFHQFMQWTHDSLAELEGQKEPLGMIAENLSSEVGLLYLDEFQVSDIGDAMILAELLKHLFLNHVSIVISSNVAPEALYKNGLQRQRFLPAIELINRKMKVLHLESQDYRMRALKQEQIYHCPSDRHSREMLLGIFQTLVPQRLSPATSIEINGRLIPTVSVSRTAVWFDFPAICGDARSAVDYLEIAKRYSIVLISEIPIFRNADDLARRFIHLIDCLYENRAILVCAAADQPERLYDKGALKQEFKRTQSRLHEMQSREYLSQNQTINAS